MRAGAKPENVISNIPAINAGKNCISGPRKKKNFSTTFGENIAVEFNSMSAFLDKKFHRNPLKDRLLITE